jgi:hypothetical protein
MAMSGLRAPARAVLIAFGATLLYGIVLAVAFDPDVQTIEAHELVERSDDARAFFVADYVFIALYAIVSPIAQWRFGRTFAGSMPWWITLTVVLLAAAGVVDATENALLLSSTDSPSQDTVDFAHGLAVPKVILFVGGALCSLVGVFRAAQALRG